MDGTIPSAVVDSGATSNVGQYDDGLKMTGCLSTKVFKVATGEEVKATKTATMEHDLREPARTVDMVPDVTLDLLASTSKFSDAGYFTNLDEEEVNVYNALTTKIVTSKLHVPKGWRDKVSTLWSIPLVKQSPRPDDGHVTSRAPGARTTSWDVKKLYSPFTPSPAKTIQNVYQLRTKTEVVRYLHAAAGFPTKPTW